MSKILYLSCHEILEYDEVKLFSELGYKVFSPGSFVCNENRGDNCLRPSIPGLVYDTDTLQAFHQLAALHPGEDAKDYLTQEFVERFDIIIVMHLPHWIIKNWNAFQGKRVIWRTIGQSISHVEAQLKPFRDAGLEIVRYSPMEETGIPGFIGQDAVIRFYKDPNDYGPWNGNNNRVITFAQSMKNRGAACNFQLFEETTRPFPRYLFGPGNEGLSWSTGKVPFEQLKQEMCNNRVYFYTGTHPASYTLNFMEALMSGIPIVAIGPQYGNASYFPGHNLYEIPNLIQNGINGFYEDNPAMLQHYIKMLLSDQDYAREIGKRGRESAIQYFGKQAIKEQWRIYLG